MAWIRFNILLLLRSSMMESSLREERSSVLVSGAEDFENSSLVSR